MRKRIQKSAISAILVMALLLQVAPWVSAADDPVVTTESTAPVQTQSTEAAVPAETTTQTTPPTELPAESEPTEPESSEMAFRIAEPTSAVYQICESLMRESEARHLFVYDTGTDTLLYSKSVGNGKLFPASITKLFSAYVALQHLDPDMIVTAGDELDLVHEGSSLAWIAKGCQLRVKTLVEGMMLPSGNDAAMILAAAAGRVIAQDDTLPATMAVDVFVDEMNRQAEILGFEQSHFSNPDGWHVGSHYTCINDLARISKLALENDTVRRYMRLAEDETTFYSGHYVFWENTNLLLHRDEGFYRSDAIGMKTGYTKPAGYSLMSAFSFDDGEIVIGLFGYTSKNNRFLDAIALVKAVKEQLRLEQASDESVG